MAKQIQLTDDSEQIRKGLAKFPWLRIAFFLLVCFAIAFPFTKTGKDVVALAKRTHFAEGKAQGEAMAVRIPDPAPVDVAPKPKLPSKLPPKIITPQPVRTPVIGVDKDSDVRKTVRGFNLKYNAEFVPGQLATYERERDDSYVADFSLKVKIPKPATTAEELMISNPELTKLLPGLEILTKHAKVSPFYETLYKNKSEYLRNRVLSLGETLTMHNFYDCQTMLEMTHPESKRKVFLFQADMDVVTDGSDGDRLSTMPDEVVKSTYYQPFTSYSWKKQTDIPNPMIAGWEERIQNAKEEIANPATSQERINWLKSRIKNKLEKGIDDMKRNSFLIAEHDPFIVISINKFAARGTDPFAPHVGDYVAVIYKDKIYPAIVGDGGPTFKVGEASLRLARTINPEASSINRPVSTLGITYVVFPGSAPRPKAAPDYELWHRECAKLLNEIGGIGSGYQLHQWENTIPVPELPEPEVEELEEQPALVNPPAATPTAPE